MFDEPKDIFAGVDEAPKAPTVQPPTAQPSSIAPPPSTTQVFSDAHVQAAVRQGGDTRGGGKTMIFLAATLALLLVAGGGMAYWYYQQALSSTLLPAEDTTSSEPDILGVDEEGKGAVLPPPLPVPTVPEQPEIVLDGDGDGLSDARESELGTSLVNNDTDGDALGDREEVDVYGTDPLRQDTDGDTFSDGSEVANGYNPNGPGRLLQIPPAPEQSL